MTSRIQATNTIGKRPTWRTHCRGLAVILIAIVCTVATSTTCFAISGLPAGKAWTPIDTLTINGHAYMVPDRFEPMPGRELRLVASGYHGAAGQIAYGLDWSDTTWSQVWLGPRDGYALWPALTPADLEYLIWKTTRCYNDRDGTRFCKLVAAEIVANQMTTPDTLAQVEAGSLLYSGAATANTRWAAVRDRDMSRPGWPQYLRVFRRTAGESWRELPVGLLRSDYPAIAPIDDSTLLVASVEDSLIMRWGYYRDTVWTQEGTFPADYREQILMFRPHPEGGYWLTWDNSSDFFARRYFPNGTWSEPETLRINGPEPNWRVLGGAIPSLDTGPYPALTWFGYDVNYPLDFVWVSLPSDSGFGVGERVEGTGGCINPTITRDENGDAWLAFWTYYVGVLWMHTYTHATCSTPVVSESAGQPLLRWTLSESAPETWWAVMRSEVGGAEQVVARVRATRDTVMQWADSTAPAGTSLTYRIRRECKDVRYQWLSPSAIWQARGAALGLALRSANPGAEAIELEVLGAGAGSIELRLYDLQGREVRRERATANGSGRDVVRVSLPGSAIAPGVYLLRARAADGRLSPARKVSVVR